MQYFFFSSRRRHTRCSRDWSSDVCSSDLVSGKSVKVEIDDSKIGEVQRLGSNPKDGSASIQFRLRLRIGDKEKDQTIKAFIKPDFMQKLGGSTYVVRKIIG